MNVLAVIPARGGSKGVPYKNLQEINGRSLLSYAVSIAVGLQLKVVVTTDDKRIADVAYRLGSEVILTSGEYLHSDQCLSSDVWRHAIEQYPDHEMSVLLEPTCPLRNYTDVHRCISACSAFPNVMTVSLATSRHKLFLLQNSKVMLESDFVRRRQSSEQYYKPNGACYAIQCDYVGDIIDGAYAVIVDRHLVNIDSHRDLLLAKTLMDAQNSDVSSR